MKENKYKEALREIYELQSDPHREGGGLLGAQRIAERALFEALEDSSKTEPTDLFKWLRK